MYRKDDWFQSNPSNLSLAFESNVFFSLLIVEIVLSAFVQRATIKFVEIDWHQAAMGSSIVWGILPAI
jgi:ABC-type multidrug transport system permease subunit